MARVFQTRAQEYAGSLNLRNLRFIYKFLTYR